VQTTVRDAAFETLTARIGAPFAITRTLGGPCDTIEAKVPRVPFKGAAGLKLAFVMLVLHYSVALSLA